MGDAHRLNAKPLGELTDMGVVHRLNAELLGELTDVSICRWEPSGVEKGAGDTDRLLHALPKLWRRDDTEGDGTGNGALDAAKSTARCGWEGELVRRDRARRGFGETMTGGHRVVPCDDIGAIC